MNTGEAHDHSYDVESAWVQPLALIEDLATHVVVLDPRFKATPEPSRTRCMELVKTEEGLVAIGPTDAHRLARQVGQLGFPPVMAIEERQD